MTRARDGIHTDTPTQANRMVWLIEREYRARTLNERDVHLGDVLQRVLAPNHGDIFSAEHGMGRTARRAPAAIQRRLVVSPVVPPRNVGEPLASKIAALAAIVPHTLFRKGPQGRRRCWAR